MKKFNINFKKTVWGILTVEAKSLEEAQKGNWDEVDVFDEFDNKSDYNYDWGSIEEVKE